MVAPGGPIQVGSGSKKPQHGATTMKRTYEVTDRADKRAVAEFLKREGPVTGGPNPLFPHGQHPFSHSGPSTLLISSS